MQNSVLALLDQMIADNALDPSLLTRYLVRDTGDGTPEGVWKSIYNWYFQLGIEDVTGRPFELSPCPFSVDELNEAKARNEVVLCVPKGVTRLELGKLFRIESWAIHDPIATKVTEKADCWFRTSMRMTPEFLGEKGLDIEQGFERENKLNFSMERYLVFIARMRYLTGKTPDAEYWIWLPAGRYDRSGMLMAGFDRNGSFNVHGWMPQFSASYLGARYGILPKSVQM